MTGVDARAQALRRLRGALAFCTVASGGSAPEEMQQISIYTEKMFDFMGRATAVERRLANHYEFC